MNRPIYCPVCGDPSLSEPPYDEHGSASFEICSCCGNEFGYDDATISHHELLLQWLSGGAKWWSSVAKPRKGWSIVEQLETAGLLNDSSDPILRSAVIRCCVERAALNINKSSERYACYRKHVELNDFHAALNELSSAAEELKDREFWRSLKDAARAMQQPDRVKQFEDRENGTL